MEEKNNKDVIDLYNSGGDFPNFPPIRDYVQVLNTSSGKQFSSDSDSNSSDSSKPEEEKVDTKIQVGGGFNFRKALLRDYDQNLLLKHEFKKVLNQF